MKRSCLLIALAMVEMTAWAYTDQEIKGSAGTGPGGGGGFEAKGDDFLRLGL